MFSVAIREQNGIKALISDRNTALAPCFIFPSVLRLLCTACSDQSFLLFVTVLFPRSKTGAAARSGRVQYSTPFHTGVHMRVRTEERLLSTAGATCDPAWNSHMFCFVRI